MNPARRRAETIYAKIVAAVPEAKRTAKWNVADLGCGAGAQCELWAERGHAVHGLDVDAGLIDTARRAAAAGVHDIDYRVGSVSEPQWPSGSMDVCLLVEVLEHVPQWQACLDECTRMLGTDGILFISTTNRLCPRQQEFDLPLYSWYPRRLKRTFERLAVTTRPDLAHGTPYPAVHWFTPYRLRRELEERGFTTADRFDMIDTSSVSPFGRGVTRLVRGVTPLRFAAHVLTPYTSILGIKR